MHRRPPPAPPPLYHLIALAVLCLSLYSFLILVVYIEDHVFTALHALIWPTPNGIHLGAFSHFSDSPLHISAPTTAIAFVPFAFCVYTPLLLGCRSSSLSSRAIRIELLISCGWQILFWLTSRTLFCNQMAQSYSARL